MKENKVDITTLIDAARFLEVPVERIRGLIRNGQLNGCVIPGDPDLGFVNVEDILDLVET